MTIKNNSLTAIARPDTLEIYAGIMARIGEINNLLERENLVSAIEIARQPNRYETAYLENGDRGIIQLVCQELLDLGFLEIYQDSLRVATYFQRTSHLEPLEQAIFDYLHVPKTTKNLFESEKLSQAIAPYCQQYRQSLIDKGYLRSNGAKYFKMGTIGLLILTSAMFKPLAALIASYRYLILPAVVVMPKASVAIAATAWFAGKSKSNPHKLTTKGKKYLIDNQNL